MAEVSKEALRYRELTSRWGWSYRFIGQLFGAGSTTADAWNRDEAKIPPEVLDWLEKADAALSVIPRPVRQPWKRGTAMVFALPAPKWAAVDPEKSAPQPAVASVPAKRPTASRPTVTVAPPKRVPARAPAPAPAPASAGARKGRGGAAR